MKKFSLYSLIAIVFFSLVGFVLTPQWAFAQEQGRRLEVTYLKLPKIDEPEFVEFPVPDYVKYIFNFLIWVAGLMAFGVLVYAGFKYLTSAGSPERIKDAKDQISAALLGLLILSGSYLILTTINPQLVIFKLKSLPPIISTLKPGVLLCKKPVSIKGAWDKINEFKTTEDIDRQREIRERLDSIFKDISKNCYTVSGTGDIRPEFDNKVTNVYFIPYIEEGEWLNEPDPICTDEHCTEYGAIFYEHSNFAGKSVPVYEHLIAENAYVEPFTFSLAAKAKEFKASSIKPFQLLYEPDEDWGVTLYEKGSCNTGFTPETARVKPPKSPLAAPGCVPEAGADPGMTLGDKWYKKFTLSWPPASIRIEGNLLAILFKPSAWKKFDPYARPNRFPGKYIPTQSPDTTGPSATFDKTDSNLKDNPNIVRWWAPPVIYAASHAYAAAMTLVILSAQIY